MQLVVLGPTPLAELLTTLPEGGAWLDARAMTEAWSVGDWGLLATRGARGVLLALEDAHAPGHDLVHGVGAHARARSTLRDARAVGLPVIVTTSITRSSGRSTTALAAELIASRIDAWWIALARTSDASVAPRVLPSLGVVVPHVLRAVDAAARAGIDVVLDGFPRCVLGPFARWQLSDPETAAGAPCDACAARVGCPGLSTLHRERFGASELRALATNPGLGEDGGDPESPRGVITSESRARGRTFTPTKTSAD